MTNFCKVLVEYLHHRWIKHDGTTWNDVTASFKNAFFKVAPITMTVKELEKRNKTKKRKVGKK